MYSAFKKSVSSPIGSLQLLASNPVLPSGDKLSAWMLVDEAGLRGRKRGGAQVSEKHANFLINTGSAKAADIEGLGEDIRAAVLAKNGIELEWEIKRLGRA